VDNKVTIIYIRNHYIYSFVYDLFNDATVVHIMTSYERLISERRILKAVKRKCPWPNVRCYQCSCQEMLKKTAYNVLGKECTGFLKM
jgi:hypothetical protein